MRDSMRSLMENLKQVKVGEKEFVFKGEVKEGKIGQYNEIYIKPVSIGKAVKVTAIFKDKNSATKYMEEHKDEGVVADTEGVIFISKIEDEGVSFSGY